MKQFAKKMLPYSLLRFLGQVRGTLLSTRSSKKWLQCRLRSEVKKCRIAGSALRVVIGSGQLWPVVGARNTNYAGWLMTDVGSLDILDPEDWRFIFPPKSIDRILAEHVFEHLTEDQFRTFLRMARGYLSPEGTIRIAVPDGYHPDEAYIQHVRPGGSGPGAHDHKMLYNHLKFIDILVDENWEYIFLEYFDKQNDFHQIHWSMADGFVQRSAKHDLRNRENALSYTSLIVDIHR